MISRGLKTCGFILGALAIAGCSEDPFDGDPRPVPNPPFYEITSASGEVEGWMLGTIHALPDGTEWRTDAIESAIASADLAIVEVGNLDDQATIAAIFTQLASTPGQPALTDRVDAGFRAPLYELIAKSDYSDHDFSSTETWAAALMLGRTHSTGDPANGVDRAIIRDFSDRSVTELEGALGQLRIFDTLAKDDQRVLLEGVVIAAKDPDSDPARLRDAWLTGEERFLEKATRTGIMSDPEIHEALIVKRNAGWARQLEKALMKAPRPLIAVGAGHLVGDGSLVEMLETRGFTVRRIVQNTLP